MPQPHEIAAVASSTAKVGEEGSCRTERRRGGSSCRIVLVPQMLLMEGKMMASAAPHTHCNDSLLGHLVGNNQNTHKLNKVMVFVERVDGYMWGCRGSCWAVPWTMMLLVVYPSPFQQLKEMLVDGSSVRQEMQDCS